MKLKPCPFCGGEAVCVKGFVGVNVFKCKKCGAIVSFNNDYYNTHKDKAFKAWNRRYEPPNEPLTLDELRQMDGDPVWVTSAIGERPMWYIVDVEESDLKNPWDRTTLEKLDKGHPYKAYRRRPKEEL